MSKVRVQKIKKSDDLSSLFLSDAVSENYDNKATAACSAVPAVPADTPVDCVIDTATNLDYAIVTLKENKGFVDAIFRNSDSIYTDLGFYNVCICSIEMPVITGMPKFIVGLQGFIYTQNSNIYVCINKDISTQNRKFAKIMLTAYVLINLSEVVANSGVYPAFAVFCKDSTTKLCINEVIPEAELLSNYLLLWQYSGSDKSVWHNFYPDYVQDSLIVNNKTNYRLQNSWGYFYVPDESENTLQNVVKVLNSYAHVVYPDSFSTSRIEMGYSSENNDSLDTILDDYDRNRTRARHSDEDRRIGFGESAFKQLQAYRKSDINYLAAKLALDYDFKDYEDFNRYLNTLINIKREGS